MPEQLLGYNYHRPVMHVLHRQMKPATAEYARECAKCPTGILWVERAEESNEFLPEVICDICSQRYFFMDAKEILRIPK